MNSTHKRRLLKLAEFLEQLDPKRFNLDSFVSKCVNAGNPVPSVTGHFCGTTACAVGYAPIALPGIFRYATKPTDSCGFDVINRQTGTGDFQAAIDAFGLEEWSDCVYLFTTSTYHKSKRGPKSVAARIRDFVKRDGKVNHETKAYVGGYE